MSGGVLGLRYIVRSDHTNRPVTVLQYKTSSGEWIDVPIVYTEEVINDHFSDWSKQFND
jgi:tRNA G18 (ribose-2'-O)-methylase SpoU